ncbi:alanine racemase [Williamwhitmania taraxaci]|uniref:Predicted amino acid racemase n=1 Tax=Williamwhitmania taraxaci TaxID=1640674 RepID=A0A1G6HKK0_9BACT|nr:alanine racemase [Williamwhitmania taraxaci]SDB93956.1 Predicted amino acid racemase [Williamwhitmania taraxaci]
MAQLIVHTNRIIANLEKIQKFLEKNDFSWTLVTKILSGQEDALRAILLHPIATKLYSVGDSRISGLRLVKEINPAVKTMYIKPPAMDVVKSIIDYADISLNTSLRTIEALNKAAAAAGKIHQIIIMLELGELREGVLRERVVDFYAKVFDLNNIEVLGLGTNLGCMYGVQPTYDKLLHLSLYKQLLELKFNKQIPLISGGSSIVLPLVGKSAMPKNVNHLRIGESAFMGTSPWDGKQFSTLSTKAFEFKANIIELASKKNFPDDQLTDGNIGHFVDSSGETQGLTYRAIVDFGLIDVDASDLAIVDDSVKFVGTTSDMTVFDLGEAKEGKVHGQYKVGDRLVFTPSYMGVARLMSTRFVDKVML